MKKCIAFVVAIAFFHAIAGIVGNAPAADKIPVRAGQVGIMKMTGEVVSVDVANKAVIIKGSKGEAAFTVDDQTRIMVGKQAKTLSDLKPGDRVQITYTTVNVAQKIVNLTGARRKAPGKANVLQTTGKVVSVDSATRTVTITTKRGSMTFTVDDETKIVIGKKGKTLEDLKPGDTLKVTYNEAAGKNVAQRITVSATGKRKQ